MKNYGLDLNENYVARYEVGITTKKMFRVKMPQEQIVAGVS